MSDLINRFKEDLQLSGYAQRSIQSYISSVLRLQRFYNKPLEEITEEELRQYWLCCQSEFGWSAASLRISYRGTGIGFFAARAASNQASSLPLIPAHNINRKREWIVFIEFPPAFFYRGLFCQNHDRNLSESDCIFLLLYIDMRHQNPIGIFNHPTIQAPFFGAPRK